MPTFNNTKLPPLPPSAVNPLPLVKTAKQFPPTLQELVRPNLTDRTAKLKGKKNG